MSFQSKLLLTASTIVLTAAAAVAHPLGQFSVNHYARISNGLDRVSVRYVVDLAELPTFQESQTADADGDGSLSKSELAAYLERVVPQYARNLQLTVDGLPVALQVINKDIGLMAGNSGSDAMGLATLRIVVDLEGRVDRKNSVSRFRFEDGNHPDRAGWRELVVTSQDGATIFDSTAFGNGITDELRAYPEDLLNSPLNERTGEWSATTGALPGDSRPLTMRDGKPLLAARDKFAELIAVRELTPGIVLIGLLFAFALGAAHALSPGHGKTIVGAYLAGSRGTARHAAFLGLTVTITHTLGVFALGLITLFASNYILPEKLYPVLSFISGALVIAIGLTLVAKRLSSAFGVAAHDHEHHHPGGRHTHLPPEIDGDAITWRSLLALGVSGGIMPCPSALVVMLAAISLNRVGYGLILIVFFSLGLASVLTAIGLLFVYGGKLMDSLPGSGKLMRALPVVSAAVITTAGVLICYQALQQGGFDFANFWSAELETTSSTSAAAILGLGLLIGLRHALDADHLAAVSTIVCERKNLLGSLLIGGLWGLGHTISLLVAGAGVILLNIQIEKYEKPLEFGVALMLIVLGLNVLFKLVRGGKLHLHEHSHGKVTHAHPHIHEHSAESGRVVDKGLKLGFRPLIIGMVHGLAGSAALMLGVLAAIKSPLLAFGYIGIFGIGSIGGMMLMSLAFGLPARFTADYFSRANIAVRALAGFFSLGFGLFLAYEIGIVEGLLR